MTQFGMAIIVGVVTINLLFTSYENTALKYTVVGVELMAFIAILIEMLLSKKRRTHYEGS